MKFKNQLDRDTFGCNYHNKKLNNYLNNRKPTQKPINPVRILIALTMVLV